MMSTKTLLSLSQAQRLLFQAQSRKSPVQPLDSSTNNDIRSNFMLQACQSYFKASRNLIFAFEHQEEMDINEVGPNSMYTYTEVKDMFCHSNNMVDFFAKEEKFPRTSLMDVGDDTVDHIFTFLNSEELYGVRLVNRLFARKLVVCLFAIFDCKLMKKACLSWLLQRIYPPFGN
jgi:hypothetical protein